MSPVQDAYAVPTSRPSMQTSRFGGLGQSDGWTLTIVRTDRGEDIGSALLADGVIDARPASEDPKAVDLMFKLAAKSRERWPDGSGTADPGPGTLPQPV